MKNVFAAVFGILISFSSMADIVEPWPPLIGKNSIGDEIHIYQASEAWITASGNIIYKPNTEKGLYYVDVHKGGVDSEKTNQTYNDLRCEFKANNQDKIYTFSCKKSGKSPLAGATYQIIKNVKPNDCSYQAMFLCTRGCDNPATPSKITQYYYECN